MPGNALSRMSLLNIEIKAFCPDLSQVRTRLLALSPQPAGTDIQEDIYFQVPSGRLKLRKGNIENALIYYQREETKGLKKSEIILYKTDPGNSPEIILAASLGIKVKVVKKREIYFLENVKFHLDEVEGLGSFAEIEAIDQDGSMGEAALAAQCLKYMEILGLTKDQCIDQSYSDMLIALHTETKQG